MIKYKNKWVVGRNVDGKWAKELMMGGRFSKERTVSAVIRTRI